MRLLPRSTCAIAVVIDSSAKNRPRARAISPASSLVSPPVTALASASCWPLPGETDSIVCAITVAGRSWSRSATSPVSASRNGTTARQACSARARLLVKPSP